jgi:hypothetical protein
MSSSASISSVASPPKKAQFAEASLLLVATGEIVQRRHLGRSGQCVALALSKVYPGRSRRRWCRTISRSSLEPEGPDFQGPVGPRLPAHEQFRNRVGTWLIHSQAHPKQSDVKIAPRPLRVNANGSGEPDCPALRQVFTLFRRIYRPISPSFDNF